MKDTKTPFVTVAVYWAVSKALLWFIQENRWEWWRLGKIKSSINFWCQSFYAFISAPGVFWLPLAEFFGYPLIFLPLLAQHHRPCTYPFYRVLLLPYLHTLFWPPPTSVIEQASLNRMAIYYFLLINTFSCDPACPAELGCHLILASRRHSFSKSQYAPWKLIQFTLN